MNNRLSLFFSIIISLPLNLIAQPDDHDYGKFYTIEKQFGDSNLDGYNLYIPNSHTDTGEAMPVIVFLQGGLGVGDNVDKIFNWALPKMVKDGPTGNSEIDELRLNTFIYVMPHIANGQFYQDPSQFNKLLQEALSNYNVDKDRIYLTGLSRGGHGTWGIGSKLPKLFAAIVPICGAQHGVDSYKGLSELPIWTSHNPDDNLVPYSETELAVDKIEGFFGKDFYRSSSVSKTKFEGEKRIFTSSSNPKKPHDAWNELYASEKFYSWLLQFD